MMTIKPNLKIRLLFLYICLLYMKQIVEYLLNKSNAKNKDKALLDTARQLFIDDSGKFCSSNIEKRFHTLEKNMNEPYIISFLEILVNLDNAGFMCAESMASDNSFYDKNRRYTKVGVKSKFYFLVGLSDDTVLLKVFNMYSNTFYKIFASKYELIIEKHETEGNIYQDYWEGNLKSEIIYNTYKDLYTDIDKIIEDIVR